MADAEDSTASDAESSAQRSIAQIPVAQVELPPLPLNYTVRQAMITCGFNDVIQRAGMTDAQRVAQESFDNDFETALYLDDADIASEAKRFSTFTQAAGKISWTVPQKNKVKAFIFWVQDLHRKGLQPSLLPFLTNTLKGGVASVPESYVGTELSYKRLQIHETDCWTLNTTKYIKNSIKNLEQRLAKINRTLPTAKQSQSPMTPGYRPELDSTQELDTDGITMYQELIGELCWATEMGRVDILFELAILSAYQASPRQGHFDQLLKIFGYLKYKPKVTLYLDSTRMPVPANVFKNNSHEFKEQYRDAKELLPHDMPTPRGNSVRITAYVDSDHASNQQTRKSHTGYIIFINRAPILWYSKRQNTVETSTFGSEFLAMKTVTEAIIALRAKLHWFGVPIDGPADVYADNESMVTCTRDFDTKLNKKHNAIAYHYCRQAVAAEVIRTGKVHTDFNIADPYTKILHGPKRNDLFLSWTY